ncbi:hypothetical protein A9310_21890 [Gordonia sp. UCD-TK1]|nr:hypothetical protein A9310_21890 [Gordonia sp. UCD-TK1]
MQASFHDVIDILSPSAPAKVFEPVVLASTRTVKHLAVRWAWADEGLQDELMHLPLSQFAGIVPHVDDEVTAVHIRCGIEHLASMRLGDAMLGCDGAVE